jgi:hypothetical protein
MGSLLYDFNSKVLEFFEEIAGRTGDIHSARNSALTILHAFDDTGWFGALRTIRALVGIHDLFTVAGLGNLRHNACSPWFERYESLCLRAECLDHSPSEYKRTSEIEPSGTSRKDFSGTGHGGNRRRRTAIEALLQVYTTRALRVNAPPSPDCSRAASLPEAELNSLPLDP